MLGTELQLPQKVQQYGHKIHNSDKLAIAELTRKIENATPQEPLRIYKSLKPFYLMICVEKIADRSIIFESVNNDPYHFGSDKVKNFGIIEG